MMSRNVVEALDEILWEVFIDEREEQEDHFAGTAERIIKYWREFANYRDENIRTTFPSVKTDQMVVVRGVPFVSLCSHHLLPFWGTVDFGYLNGNEVIGLSKIARIIKLQAKRPQVQEDLGHMIADKFEEVMSDCRGLMLRITAQHSCMMFRGVESPGQMVTSVIRGEFHKKPHLKQEWLSLVG